MTSAFAAAMTASQPLNPALPPMPRRQTCDRCHEQKVRCVTERPDGAFAVGEFAAGNQAGRGGHLVASVPCVRCRKAGAICIYSPQLRPGRPRVRQYSHGLSPSRKRTRAVSRCASRPSLSPTPSQPVSPPSSSQPYTAAGFPPGGASFGLLEDPDEHAYARASPESSYWQSPVPAASSWGHGSRDASVYETPPPAQMPWPALPYDSYDAHLFADMGHMSAFLEDPAASDTPYVATFSDPALPTDEGGCTWASATPDHSLEELAQISLRVFSATRALPPQGSPLAVPPSPAVNTLFDVACLFANAVARHASNTSVTPSQPHGSHINNNNQAPPPPPPTHNPNTTHADTRATSPNLQPPSTPSPSSPIQTALASSALLTIHATRRALLAAFEAIAAALLQRCTAPDPPPASLDHGPQTAPPPATPPDAPLLSQAAAIAALMGRVLDLLDRASPVLFAGAAGCGARVVQRQQRQQQQQCGEWDLVVVGDGVPGCQGAAGAGDGGASGDGEGEGTGRRGDAVRVLFDEMARQEGRVREMVRAVARVNMGQRGVGV